MIRNRRNSGFTLIELMIVVAIIAIIAAIAIPKLLSARISANESAAIATLRSIAAAQQQFQASAAIDTNADGGGEYGYFGELSGIDPMRVYNGGVGPAAAAAAGGAADILDPPFLATAFGDVRTDSTNGAVTRQGYMFKIFLPGPNPLGAAVSGFGEDPTGGGSAQIANIGSDNCEVFWCAYAWPETAGKTGTRAFFINQEGDVIQHDNRTVVYNGVLAGLQPLFSDAYASAPTALSMDTPLGLAVMGNTPNIAARNWTAVGN